MNRILPLFFVLSGFFLAAANPDDRQVQPRTSDPSANAKEAADGNGDTLLVPPRQRAVVDPARLLEALPEEREAVRAAIVGRGGAGYDNRGRVRSIGSEEATDADMRLFGALPGLEALSVGPPVRKCLEARYGHPTVSDAGMTSLLKTSKLRSVDLVDTQVTNEGLKVIGQLTDIESLRLCSPQITGAGMAYLDGLKHLQSLYLTGCRVGDDGMRSIAGHAILRRLHLDGSATRRGLAELVRLSSLDELRIDRGFIRDDDLVPIGQITSLGSL